MYSTTIKRTTATALAAAALAAAAVAPDASARIPDRVPPGGWPDMHASVAIAAAEAREKQDLRSPDTRDAAEGRGTFNAPEVTIVKPPQTAPPASSSGLDLGDTVIGAGGALAVILLAGGGAFAVVHRRRTAGVVPGARHRGNAARRPPRREPCTERSLGTTSRTAARLDRINAVHKHGPGGREHSTERSPKPALARSPGGGRSCRDALPQNGRRHALARRPHSRSLVHADDQGPSGRTTRRDGRTAIRKATEAHGPGQFHIARPGRASAGRPAHCRGAAHR
jgi:hypothetical protein